MVCAVWVVAWFINRSKGTWLLTIIEGALFSFGIETAQFILGTGMADIDDLIFNTLGAIIGVTLYKGYRILKH